MRAATKGRSTRYLLCFRLDGRQVSRYLGKSAFEAEAIREALSNHQASRDLKKRLKTRLTSLRKFVRERKPALRAELAAHGLHLHGRTVRKRRTPMV